MDAIGPYVIPLPQTVNRVLAVVLLLLALAWITYEVGWGGGKDSK